MQADAFDEMPAALVSRSLRAWRANKGVSLMRLRLAYISPAMASLPANRFRSLYPQSRHLFSAVRASID